MVVIKVNIRRLCICIMVLSIALIGAIFYDRKSSVATNVESSKRQLPIYCVDTTDKKVALSFDAAWGNEDTKEILDVLKKENVKVTFFMTGGWVDAYPDDVKQIAAAGHDLANHSEHHKQMSKLSKEECIKEIEDVHNRVKELTGREMNLFRPPYGDYNNNLIEIVNEMDYYPIQWDVDSLDWKEYGTEQLINTVLNHKHLQNGSIILCHNGAKYTAEALPGLIKGLKEKGYKIVPVSEIIYKDNYTIDVEGKQHKLS